MAKIGQSTINPLTNFVYNGLEYKKGVWELYYNNKSKDEQGIDLGIVRVGIRSTYTSRVLQNPLPVSSWKDASDTPYNDIQSLLIDVIPLISFNGDTKIGLTQRVDTFGDLVSGTLIGDLAYVNNSEGTKWLPSNLGGTYYPKGWYFWDGVEWLSDRDAIAKQLQDNIDSLLNKVDKEFLGWVQVTDGQYDTATRYSIPQGIRTKIPNNSADVLNVTNLFGATTLWNSVTNKFENDNSGDSFNMRVQFVANPSLNNRDLTLELDIGGAQGVIWSKTIQLARGAGTNNRITENIHFYTLNTFIANGGELYLTCDSDVDVFDIRFLIERTYRND